MLRRPGLAADVGGDDDRDRPPTPDGLRDLLDCSVVPEAASCGSWVVWLDRAGERLPSPIGQLGLDLQPDHGVFLGAQVHDCLHAECDVALWRSHRRHCIAGQFAAQSAVSATARVEVASCCARASTAMAWAGSLSAGSGRCTAVSVRRMLASSIASAWSDLGPGHRVPFPVAGCQGLGHCRARGPPWCPP